MCVTVGAAGGGEREQQVQAVRMAGRPGDVAVPVAVGVLHLGPDVVAGHVPEADGGCRPRTMQRP
jgi:hypothetical protein